MGKALVIKGTNFLVNKLATVNLGNTVPCTAISLSDESIALTAIGATYTITATLTPNNTTDTVQWVSSNENVATVSEGIVTCTGVGSATITAICGEQTATCSVTTTVTIAANTALTGTNGFAHSGADISNSKDYISCSESTKSRVYLDPTETPTGYHAASGINAGSSPWSTLYPIMIPNNTEKISVTAPAGLKNHVYITLLDSTAHPTYNVANLGVKGVSTSTDIKSTMEYDLTEHTGYDSFVLTLQTTGGDPSAVTGDVTIVFS